MDHPIEVVFCCDQNMIPGLHVTVHSMLSAYNSKRELNITWLHQGVADKDIASLQSTIDQHSHNVNLSCINHNTSRFENSAALHGSRFPYARLDIPNLITADRVLYLDSDLIINVDVSQLYDVDLEDHILGIPYDGGKVALSLERSFFEDELGISADSPYFNSGVLVIDLASWRQQSIDIKVDDFLEKHGSRCLTCDQTVLNALFTNNFKALPQFYNHELAAVGSHYLPVEKAILHFVGRPKPWDIGGRRTNPHSDLWYKVLLETAIGDWKSSFDHSAWASVKASWRSSLRAMLSTSKPKQR